MRLTISLSLAVLAGCGVATPTSTIPDVTLDASSPRADAAPSDDPVPPTTSVVVAGVRELPAMSSQGAAQRWGERVMFLRDDNRANVTDDLDARDGITNLHSPSASPDFAVLPWTVEGCPGFFALSPYAAGAWIMSERGGLVSFARGCTREGPEADYRGAGLGWWTAPDAPLQLPRRDARPGEPDILMPPGAFRPTSALVREGSGADATLYAFDCNTVTSVVHGCRVARVPESRVDDPSAWRYWNGLDWSTVGPGVHVTETAAPDVTVSYNAFLQRYLMVYGSVWSNGEIAYRTAPQLTGPWSSPVTILRPRLPSASAFWYTRAHHLLPYDRDGGRTIYIAYDSSLDGGTTLNHPLIEVTFARSR